MGHKEPTQPDLFSRNCDNSSEKPLTIDRAKEIVVYAEDEIASGRRIEDAFMPFSEGGAVTRLEAVQALYIVIADYFHSACLGDSGSSGAMNHFENYAKLSGELSWRILCDNIRDLEKVPDALGNQETVESFVCYLKTLSAASADFWPQVYQRIGLGAAMWFRNPAERGDADAQFKLGCCYDQGHGVTKDYVEAFKWFLKAADQGHANAQFNLGICYTRGDGVTEDNVEAIKWFRKAAGQGIAGAQHVLGVCCLFGDGMTKDYVQAYKWLNLASAQGNDKSKKSLTELEQRMTKEQLAEAQRLAREFKPSRPIEGGR